MISKRIFYFDETKKPQTKEGEEAVKVSADAFAITQLLEAILKKL